MHISYFHDYYKTHKEELNREIHTIDVKEFMRKYDIWQVMYTTYFWGHKKHWKIGISDPEERIKVRKEKIRERYDDCTEYFNDKVSRLAWKLRVPKKDIIKLTQSYTISEIEQFEKVDGVIKCEDLIKMKRPGDWRENLCCCMERD